MGNTNSEGCNTLIKAGANTVTSAHDVLSVYEFIYPHRISIESAVRAERELTRKSGQESARRRHIASRPSKEAEAAMKKEKQLTERAESKKYRDEMRGGDGESFSFERDRREREAEKKQSAQAPDAADDKALPVTDTERRVLDAVGDGAVTPDELCAQGFSPAEVMSALTILEILGLVTAVPGGRYMKTNR